MYNNLSYLSLSHIIPFILVHDYKNTLYTYVYKYNYLKTVCPIVLLSVFARINILYTENKLSNTFYKYYKRENKKKNKKRKKKDDDHLVGPFMFYGNKSILSTHYIIWLNIFFNQFIFCFYLIFFFFLYYNFSYNACLFISSLEDRR